MFLNPNYFLIRGTPSLQLTSSCISCQHPNYPETYPTPIQQQSHANTSHPIHAFIRYFIQTMWKFIQQPSKCHPQTSMQHISTNPSSARFCQHTAACQRCCSTCCFRSATRAALSIVSANFANVASRLSPRGLGRGACSVLPSPMRSTWELNGEACSRWCHRLLAKIVYKFISIIGLV